MATMNARATLDQLRARLSKSQQCDDTSFVVGYTAHYALYVHEKIEMKWRGLKRKGGLPGVYWGPGGEAKFLEGPFRRLANTLAQLIVDRYKSTGSMRSAILVAALRLQRESQLLTPMVTGHLRNSAFTREDKK